MDRRPNAEGILARAPSVSQDRDARVRRLLGGAELRKLWAAARQRLERDGEAARSVTLTGLELDERQALAGLLGWAALPGRRARVSLARLNQALRASRLECGLRQALEALGGPLADLRAQRDREHQQQQAMWSRASQSPAVAGRPALRKWLDELRARGLLSRAARRSGVAPEELLRDALDLVQRLPAGGALLSSLAADLTGDAHALDHGRPLAGLGLRAAARLRGWPEVPRAAAQRRRLWAEVGVLCDPLSSHVLCLGLRPVGPGRLADSLRQSASEGEPSRLTLRELHRGAELVLAAPQVHVCENPAVVAAAADMLGSDCAPLVCTEGIPSTAALELLDRICSGGASLRVQCDFDWGGLRIGNLLHQQFDAAPWRLTGRQYRRLLSGQRPRTPLRGTPEDASWDPGLRPALEAAGLALFEEQLLDELLGDLGGAARR